ncbi:MAG: GNAT family N-acetyltransferase [Panacibacter sp.]
MKTDKIISVGKNMLSVTVRPMQKDDIADAIKLSNAEGWNQTENDWKLLIKNDQNICMLAECNDKIIGTCTVMNYANHIAWIGMVLVDKAYRRQGVSKLLLENIFRNLKSFKSVKLDATPAGQQVYTKFGFKEEYLIARMAITSAKLLTANEDDGSIAPAELKDVPEIITLDKIVFGADRTILIESLIRRYPQKAWVLKRDNSITGFALGRDGNKYHQIGPLIASTTKDTYALFRKAMKAINKQPVVVDVICDKESLIKSLSSLGFVKQRSFVRMYKNENPFPGTIAQYHLACGPEFG